MARQTTKSRKSSSSSRRAQNGRRRSSGGSARSNGRSASQKPEKYRFAQNVDGQETVAEREYRSYATSDDAGEVGQDPDVLLAVPVVKVERIHLKVEELEAHVSLNAKVLDLVTLDVGVDVHLGKLELEIEGVEAQALVKVRLDHVAAIVDRTLTTIDRNPELTKSLGRALEDIGQGAGQTLGETGEAVEDVGEGAGEAVGEVGEGAGQAVGELGEGAGQAAGQLGQGAGQAVEGVGQGAGQAVGNLDQLAGQLGQGVGELGQGVGQAAGGAGQAAGQLGQGAGAGPAQTAKLLAKELGAAATDEAKELGQAATVKAKELAERRRRKRAEKHDATESALQLADELGVDLEDVEGSGAEGRITVRDVKRASSET
jgi:pyruvate/2-oxoglutarate dehydrogenase complex dihydrolipoamide acyltransferase (E2) component